MLPSLQPSPPWLNSMRQWLTLFLSSVAMPPLDRECASIPGD